MSDAPQSPFRPDLFADQVAFVTGGATGIGKEICRASAGTAGASPSRAASRTRSMPPRPSSRPRASTCTSTL